MKTYPYKKYTSENEIKTGNMYYFGQLWNGNKNEEVGMEILLSGEIEIENSIVYFIKGEINEDDFRNTIVRVTGFTKIK